MPPPLLLDLSQIDTTRIIADRKAIYEALPHRHEFMQLDGVCHFDPDKGFGVAFRDVKTDEWWARGHIPGHPIFPGALMLESAAQAVAYFSKLTRKDTIFMAFGGVDECKFRGAVYPPTRLYFICRELDNRPRRTIGHVQGIAKGQLVFEAKITGLGLAGMTN